MHANFERPEYPDIAREPLLELVPENTHAVLDIGCNKGGFGHSLKSARGVEIVWGVEPDKEAAFSAEGRLDCVINDFYHEGNPIPDGFFDVITFNDSLEHMVDPASALLLSKKKLNTGGRIHCCVPNIRHIANIEHLLFEQDWRYEDCGIRDRTHLRFFTEKSIVRLFSECGYRVLRVFGINEDWWHQDKRLRRVMFKLFPKLTLDMRHIQIVVIAEPVR